ncbi:MAG: DegT/DnrJ/EryC1/StrS family aminotransferase [Anaerolineae bacterium]|jgi:dTDP-4-amino-4,6-dideoxygalactose transaminase
MPKLAINGGTPVVPGGLQPRWPIIDETDRQALLEVLDSGKWCSAGFYYADPLDSKVAQFEKAWAEWVGSRYAVAVSNGTAALTLALKAAGIEAGDEVIVPAVTFIASATAVVLANAIPVFADIVPDTYQIDPDHVESLITSRTRAIMPVHYGGYPADMDRIMEIAGKHDLVVVEDCAEAHGSEWRGKRVGSVGHLGAFSHQMGKPLAAGEGGSITTSDDGFARNCYSYGDLGRIPGGAKYEHYIPAGNNRITEFQGALLLTALARLDAQTETRYQNGEYFARELDRIGGIPALKRGDPRITKRGYYFYFLRYQPQEWGGVPRDRFVQALNAEGIHAGTAHNQPLYKNPVFAQMSFGRTGCPVLCPHHGEPPDYSKVSCPQAERVYETEVVALGKDFLMDRADVDRVLEAIAKLKANVAELG